MAPTPLASCFGAGVVPLGGGVTGLGRSSLLLGLGRGRKGLGRDEDARILSSLLFLLVCTTAPDLRNLDTLM